ncbi:MAG: TolC family protein [Candidatus Cloacimonetes bacterium]|jgi:outer membrane protein TolC|nr:TolC family protein [Candidatus Cloacimonadota bacterium]
MKRIVAIILIIVPILIFAEEYTLEELIDIGLENSYDMKLENVNDLNAQSELRSSWFGLLPSASIFAGSSKNFDTNLDWSKSASFQLSKNISLNEPSYYDVRTSILNKRNADLSLENRRKLIAYTVFNKYLSVLEAQKNLEIQKENLILQQKINGQVEVQFETGDKSALELQQSKISLIDYEIAVNEAKNSLVKLRKDLFSYLNINDEEFELSAPDIDITIESAEFVTNIALKQKENTLKSSKIILFQQKMNFLPTISMSYSLYHDDPNDVYDFSNYDRTNNTLSLNASYNIFNLLETRELYLQSKRNHELLEMDLEITKESNVIDLQNLLSDLETIKISKKLYADKLELAEKNLQMAQELYKHGMISLLDLDRSKIEFQNSTISNMSNKFELLRKQEEINLLLSNKILGKW